MIRAMLCLCLAVIAGGGLWWDHREKEWERNMRGLGKDLQAHCTTAVHNLSAHHLKKCKEAIGKVEARCNTDVQRETTRAWGVDCGKCPTLHCPKYSCEPYKREVQYVVRGPCDDPPPCRWDDVERGKLSKWRVCAGLISEAHARWTKADCDPMPCHCN